MPFVAEAIANGFPVSMQSTVRSLLVYSLLPPLTGPQSLQSFGLGHRTFTLTTRVSIKSSSTFPSLSGLGRLMLILGRIFNPRSSFLKEPQFYGALDAKGAFMSIVDPQEFRAYRQHYGSLFSTRAVMAMYPVIAANISKCSDVLLQSLTCGKPVDLQMLYRNMVVRDPQHVKSNVSDGGNSHRQISCVKLCWVRVSISFNVVMQVILSWLHSTRYILPHGLVQDPFFCPVFILALELTIMNLVITFPSVARLLNLLPESWQARIAPEFAWFRGVRYTTYIGLNTLVSIYHNANLRRFAKNGSRRPKYARQRALPQRTLHTLISMLIWINVIHAFDHLQIPSRTPSNSF